METSYDTVRYPTSVNPDTLPSTLSALAHLRGRRYVPFSRSRILEIGCGTGGNILNLAAMAPDAQCVGFDLAAIPIAEGQEVATAAGLSNIELRQGDILDPNVVSGTFDYILVHGVLAWVPGVVRQGLMGLIGRHLSDDGLAFVSYNVMPGCNLRLMIRAALMDSIAGVEGADEKVAAAKEALKFYLHAWPLTGSLGEALAREAKSIVDQRPAAVFHDILGECYEPQSLGDVVAEARRNGLDYLCDSQPRLSRQAFYPSSDAHAIHARSKGDWVRFEQISDLVNQRTFRHSILCRPGKPPVHLPDISRLKPLFANGKFTPAPIAEGVQAFRTASDDAINVTYEPLATLLTKITNAYPGTVALEPFVDDPRIGNPIWELYTRGMLTLLTEPLHLVTAPGERPEALRLARAQAARGEPAMGSLRHVGLNIKDPGGARFITFLDGTRSHKQLAEVFAQEADLPLEETQRRMPEVLRELGLMGIMVA